MKNDKVILSPALKAWIVVYFKYCLYVFKQRVVKKCAYTRISGDDAAYIFS